MSDCPGLYDAGKLSHLPTILTTSGEIGPNGPLPHEILEMHENAPLIRRRGEINAWEILLVVRL
ncbi:hypothetical protein L218DRAFT_997348 [Marasmius fiardii PR-910]|nr:hypothetical protein L218DRAFT_997348 [Marasmius fiardii PR-910]